jgi:hypothetical protein
MKLWKLRLVWCEECRRIVRWRRGAHLLQHSLPPGVMREPDAS